MTKDIFLERKQYSDIIEKRIRGLRDGYRQNIAIIGDELSGKTSLIHGVLNKFYDNRFILIYLELRVEPLDSFVKRFIGVLLYNFLLNSNIPLKEDIDFLIDKSCGYIPKTIAQIKHILASLTRRGKTNVFSDLLSLCDIINQETSKFCVVIFDEFLHLEDLGVKDLYSQWCKLLILQKNTMYIITSSLPSKAKLTLSKNLSLLFGNFEVINMEYFNIKECGQYMEFKIKLNEILPPTPTLRRGDQSLPLTRRGRDDPDSRYKTYGIPTKSGICRGQLNSGLKNFIVHFTGGCPFYLKILTDELLRRPANHGSDGSPQNDKTCALTEIIQQLLFDDSGLLNQRFSDYIKRISADQDYLSILYLISQGNNKLKEIAYLLHKPVKELEVRINNLSELNMITISGNLLKINDRVFAFWLKFVYHQKRQSLTFDAKEQKNLFRDKIEDTIREFLVNAAKPISERVSELLCLFENDTIQIEKKRLKLSRFREIKPIEFSKSQLKNGLLGRSNDSLWILAFKQGLVTEEDITEFAQECKKYRHKLQKKIMVTLQDIDDNAKLRALEEKIWTWDIRSLNQLLDLFSKPRVIV